MSRRWEVSLAIAFGFLFSAAAEEVGVPFPWPFVVGAAGIVFVVAVYRWLLR